MSEKVLVVSPNCPSCKAVEKFLIEKGLLDSYRVVDVSTPEGLEFAKRAGVQGVPECLVVDHEKKVVRVCSDDEWKEMLGKK